MKDDKGRYVVAYNATVRLTHRRSGVYRGEIVVYKFYVVIACINKLADPAFFVLSF